MSAEHVVDLWLDKAQVTTLSQEQVALLVEAVDQYGDHRERMLIDLGYCSRHAWEEK